ncbi:methyltransferase domain protein [Rhodococcus sp. MTM3W5.2]|nr:methyltransferase domain protein [Rhodococcus sp. MTM3W5.2]
MSEWDGEGYAEVSGLQRTLAERSLSGLELTGAERLLDVGCGDGFITLALAGRLPRGSAVGVDVSAKMIDKARSRPVPDGASATFLVADARELPFEDEFDVVVSFNALHWVSEQRRALAGIARAAHPSARGSSRWCARASGRASSRWPCACAGSRPGPRRSSSSRRRSPTSTRPSIRSWPRRQASS